MKTDNYWDGYWTGYIEALGFHKSTKEGKEKYEHLLEHRDNTASSATTVFLASPVSPTPKSPSDSSVSNPNK